MTLHARTSRGDTAPVRPDAAVGVRDGDLLPEQQTMIANVRAQIADIVERHGAATLEDFILQLEAARQSDILAAQDDVAQLMRLVERLHDLVENADRVKEAFRNRAASEELAREATDGIALDVITILRAASENPPMQLEILSPVLETHLVNDSRAEIERTLELMRVDFMGKQSMVLLPLGYTAEPFRVLGRFGKHAEAESLLAGIPMKFRAGYMANYAVGLAEAGKDEEADEAFADAEARAPEDAADRGYASIVLAKALHACGRDTSRAVAAAEGAIANVMFRSPATRVGMLQDAVRTMCVEVGDTQAAIRQNGRWNHQVLAECYRGNFDKLTFDGDHTVTDKRRVAEKALPLIVAAKAWPYMTRLTGQHLLRPEDVAKEVARSATLTEYEEFLTANPRLQSNVGVRFCHAELLVREGRGDDAAKTIDAIHAEGRDPYLHNDPAYPALLYRIGRGVLAELAIELQTNTLAHILFAQAVRPDEAQVQEALSRVATLLPGAPGRPYTSRSEQGVPREVAMAKYNVCMELLSCGFVDEARKYARGIDATVGDGWFAGAWAEIGAWYAKNALRNAKEAYTVLEKLKE